MARSASRRRVAWVLGGGAALIGVFWSLGPASSPPLYDSLPPVVDAYRYCQVPAGVGSTKRPATVDHNVRVENGQSPAIADSTAEQPPQAELLAARNAFVVPPGTITIRVAIQCAAPPTVLPPDGRLDGNVYAFTVSAGGAPLSIRPGQQVTVVLRGPAGVPSPVLELLSAGQWTRQDTQPLSNTAPDSYAANLSVLDELALVVASQSVPAGDGADHGPLITALVIATAVLLAAGAVLALRGRGGRTPG